MSDVTAASDDVPNGPRPAGLGARLGRGFKHRCPNCGEHHLFRSYLKQVKSCGVCQAELGDIRADDFPPYVTMFLVGHIVVPLILVVEQFYAPSTWIHLALWLPLACIMLFVLMPRVKGAIIGLMWHLRIKGGEFQ